MGMGPRCAWKKGLLCGRELRMQQLLGGGHPDKAIKSLDSHAPWGHLHTSPRNPDPVSKTQYTKQQGAHALTSLPSSSSKMSPLHWLKTSARASSVIVQARSNRTSATMVTWYTCEWRKKSRSFGCQRAAWRVEQSQFIRAIVANCFALLLCGRAVYLLPTGRGL